MKVLDNKKDKEETDMLNVSFWVRLEILFVFDAKITCYKSASRLSDHMCAILKYFTII